ncbi:MAG: glutamate racemase [Cyclobacteriaceae bacterium]|nr:glutamate racemase [Cyclobacteriaceae bacterium]
MMKNNQPIGLFDSGIGGLTVAKAVKKILPNERIIYFGDTAHLPYGDKSEAAIQSYSIKIADVLLKAKCKVILIACNSASSSSYELLKEYVGKRVKIINVIDPMVRFVGANFPNRKVGLIGTKRTVLSEVYDQKIKALDADISLKSLATPLLVPMIEEGYFNNKISHEIIEEYLAHKQLQNIDGLILGCTHYPLIKDEIQLLTSNDLEIVDSAHVVALSLKQYLEEENLKNDKVEEPDLFMVSDFTTSFESSANMFFDSPIKLIKHSLWD